VRLGAVIVSHQSASCLRSCLEACLHYGSTSEGIIVVDNASTDDSVRVASSVPGVTVFPNPDNPGFSAGVNQGFRALPFADLILLLNPDAILQNIIEPLVRCFDDPLIAIAAGALCDPDLQPQRGFTVRRFPTPAALVLENLAINRVWPGNFVNRRWRCLDLDLTRSQDADQPAGAFLLIRREAWKAVGGFDEGFRPVWFEDVDFCLRVRNSGFRIRYEPSALAVHEGGHSVCSLDWGERQLYWNENLLRYSGLHFTPAGQFVTALAVAAGGAVRGLWEALRRGSPDPLRVGGLILRASATALLAAVRSARRGSSKDCREGNSERG
jgi:N-acetylglucosaminyl-diphospho-decaprenol L-rhamnosyltransferase